MNSQSAQTLAEPLLLHDVRTLSNQSAPALLRALGTVGAALCIRCAAEARLAWQRHTTRDELRELTPCALKDIGLSRDDADQEGAKWFWRE